MFVINEFTLICGLVLTVLSLNSVTAKKFCTAFNENNQKIDYGIRLPETQSINFVINGLFWTIDNYLDKNKETLLKFGSEESKTTTFFTSEYKFGSKVFFHKNHKFKNGFVILFNKNNLKSVAIGNATNSGKNSDLSKFQKIRDSQVTNELIPNDTVFAFPEDFQDEERTKVVFVRQVGSGYDIKLLQFEVVSDSTIKASKTTSKYSMAVIKESKTNLVYASPLWDERTQTYKLFLIFRNNNLFTYCYTKHDNLDATCKNPKELILCPEPVTVVPDDENENGGSNSMSLIIAIIIIIILIVVIIGFVVFFFNRPNASEAVTANSQLSGMNAPLSKRSGDVTSKVASKTGTSKVASKIGAKGTSNVQSKIGPKNSAKPTSKPA